MSRIDRTIAHFMIWCEHPLWERRYHYHGMKANLAILNAKLIGFSWILDVTAPIATPWMARAYQRYFARLRDEAARFKASVRARTGDGLG